MPKMPMNTKAMPAQRKKMTAAEKMKYDIYNGRVARPAPKPSANRASRGSVGGKMAQ